MTPRLSRRHLLTTATAALALPRVARGEATPGPLAELVAQVDRARLEATVTTLAAFPTRWTPSPAFPQVEDWMHEAFARVGAERIARQAYPHSSAGTRHNVLCGDPLDPRGVLLLGAHLDSISETPATHAPGANDNASGIAAMLEACRILTPQPLRKGLVFVAFSGEEQDLQGSTACATIARRQGWPIDLMLNLDMLGHPPATPSGPLFIEYDQGNAVAGNEAAAAHHGRQAARLAARFTDLATEHTDIWDSDYMPFEARGYPCIGFYDGGVEAPEYHSTADIPEAVDFDRLFQVTRLVVATLAKAAG